MPAQVQPVHLLLPLFELGRVISSHDQPIELSVSLYGDAAAAALASWAAGHGYTVELEPMTRLEYSVPKAWQVSRVTIPRCTITVHGDDQPDPTDPGATPDPAVGAL